MALLKLRRASQITLPTELRKRFKLSEGDYLEATAIKEGILLKPVAVVEREAAWNEVFQAMEKVKERKPRRTRSISAREEEIAGLVKASRKRNAQGRP